MALLSLLAWGWIWRGDLAPLGWPKRLPSQPPQPVCRAYTAQRDATQRLQLGCQMSSSALPVPLPARWRLLVGLPLDINQVSSAELQLLAGVGPQRAQAVVAQRQAQGPFTNVAALRRVPGWGAAMLQRLEPYLTVESAAGP